MTDEDPLADFFLEGCKDLELSVGIDMAFPPAATEQTAHFHDGQIADIHGSVGLNIGFHVLRVLR